MHSHPAMFGLLGSLLLASASLAADAVSPGKLTSGTGSLIIREAAGKPWKVGTAGEAIPAEQMLISVPRASITLSSGVRLDMLADLERRSSFPVIESAVVLHPPGKNDGSITLDRGRVAITGRAKESSQVEVRFHDQAWTLHMKPGSHVAMEIYGRWGKGTIFKTKPGPKDTPVFDLVVVVLDGEVQLDTDCHHFLMKQPPGLAFLQWDSVTGCDSRPSRLEKRPTWADPVDPDTPHYKQRHERFERFRKSMLSSSIETTLESYVSSENIEERRLGVYGLAALDELARFGDAVLKTKHPDVMDNAILALRHWLGRGPEQGQKLYSFLVTKRNYSAAQASTIVQLIHSFSDQDLSCPDCYEMLIDYLKSDKLAIRSLANWHLVRLVPAGRDIKFVPTAGPEEWDRAFKAWKKLVPDGKFPPPATAEKK